MKANALAGLMPPEPPPLPSADPWPLIGLIVLFCLSALALRLWWRQPHRRRLRRLSTLEADLHAATADTRRLAAEMEGLLRCAPDIADRVDSQPLFAQLHRIRFGRDEPSPAQLSGLLPQARMLMRREQRHG